ncbi:putative U3 small nucleolar RNA-associated protein 13 [Neolecta irregularis DAH-3]|uniref:Putative U3 small nucleolar RNA-associated protein 13 n=1 Tax=Neolecta irregularis (strain DAH-3) TaxID=1198029 RepID=A0A1U7LPK9_NEOID|nr:putative U3 small nucleolar RNA-associated protein 13 [Neolecta irregularis DAH-3]|eukprot:OLL24523.1 putative U3 small nucleolar RNA-associated protein 13 [Neolecta irregularis DAH-3]
MVPSIRSLKLKTNFCASKVLEPIYSGGKTCIAADGKTFAGTLGEDVEVTDILNGSRICRIPGDSEVVTTLTLLPSGSHLVVCSRSLQMRIYSLPSGKLIRSLKAHDAPVIAMDADSTSTLVATGGAEGTVKVWDIEGGYMTHNFKGHGGIVSVVKFCGKTNGSRWTLASGSDDCKIRVWDLVKRTCLAILDSHVSVITSLDFSSDGWTLLSAGRDKVISLWDLKSYKLKQTIPIFETIEAAGFFAQPSNDSTSAQLIYTGGDKGVVRVWDLTSGQEISSCECTISNVGISDIHYRPESTTFLSILSDQKIIQHAPSTSNLQIIRRIAGQHDEIIDCTYVSEDQKYIAIATNSNEIGILDVDGFDCTFVEGHSDIVICLDRSLDGNWLATGSKDNSAKLWKLEFGKTVEATCVSTFTGHAESIGAIGLSKTTQKPKFVLTGSQDRTIKRWDISDIKNTNRALYTQKAHEKDINAIDVASDDTVFASASQDRTVKIWAAIDGELKGTLKGHKRGVWSARFAKAAKLIVTGSGDKTIKLWNTSDYSCLKTFEGHTNSVLKVLWLGNGLQVASAAADGLIKVWSVKSGECNSTLDNHTERVWSLAVRNDEEYLVSGGGDSVINFWQDVSEIERESEAKATQEQVEKEQELSNYLLHRDWRNAIILAMSLDQPYQLLRLFTQVSNDRVIGDKSITGLGVIDEILASLSKDQLKTLLLRLRDWNTNARTAGVAQRVLHVLLRFYSPDTFLEIEDIKNTIDAMLPYSERHFKRTEELVEESYIVDYTVRAFELWALIALAVVFALVVLFSITFTKVFQHRNEKDALSTTVTIISLSLILFTVLLVPVDVFLVKFPHIRKMDRTGLKKDWATEQCVSSILYELKVGYYSLYSLDLALCFVVIPFTYFFYEEEIDESGGTLRNRFNSALKYTIMFLLVDALILLVGIFIPLSKTSISKNLDLEYIKRLLSENVGEKALSFSVGVLLTLGMFLYVLYTSTGLALLPISVIKSLPTITSTSANEIRQALHHNRERQHMIEVRYESSDDSLSSKDRRELEQLQREERTLIRRARLADGGESGLLSKFSAALWPFKLFYGFFLLMLSLILFVSMAITSVDKAVNSFCGKDCGFILAEIQVFNPVNWIFIQSSKLFPFDYVLMTLLVLYMFLASVIGIIFVGIRFLWVHLYQVRRSGTLPQGLLVCYVDDSKLNNQVCAVFLMLNTIAINYTLVTIALPQYSVYGNQRYCNYTKGEYGEIRDCSKHLDRIIRCSKDAPQDICTPSMVSQFLDRIIFSFPFFGWIAFFGQFAFCAIFLIMLITAVVRTPQLNDEEDDEPDETEGLLSGVRKRWNSSVGNVQSNTGP